MQVAIIGGGIAGPLLALTLHQLGVSCAVYESRSDEAIASGSITLTANSLRSLNALGLYERVRAAAAEFSIASYLNADFKVLANFRLGGTDVYGYPALSVQKEALRRILLDACRESSIEVRFDLEFFGIRDTGGQEVLEVHFRTAIKSPIQDGDEISKDINSSPDVVAVTADIVVGADGFDSAVRRICFLGVSSPEYFGLVSLTGKLPRSALPETEVPEACSVFSRSNFLAFKPLPNTPTSQEPMVSFVANFGHDNLSVEDWCRLQSIDGHESRLKMLTDEYCSEDGPWPSWLRDVLARPHDEEIGCWPHYTLPELRTYLAMGKRVVLVGDAAHGMPPTTAQGANAAIEDAHSLGLVIANACSSRDSLAVSLTNWDNHRRSRIKRILEHDLQGSNLILKRSSARTQKLKEKAMKILYRTVLGETGGLKWVFEYDSTKILRLIEKETARKRTKKVSV